MAENQITVLFIEDNPGDARLFQEMLKEAKGDSFLPVHRARLSDGLAYLAGNPVDVILLDLGLPDSQGLDTFLSLQKECEHIPVIVLTGLTDNRLAGRAMEGGAQDYLTKESINGQLLAQSIRYAIERKRVEKELREGEDRYRDLIENSLDLICTHDLKGQILSVNQEPLRILGYDKDAILKQKINMRDLLIPKRRAEFDEYLATIRSKGVASGLMVIQTAKGEKRVWEYRNTLRTDGVSEPIVRGMAHDVTERLKKDKEIKDTLAKLRRAIGSIIQAMAATVETRDPYTAGHQRRGADLARAIASEMNRSTDEIDGIRMAGMIHDIGKISVPAEILSKPTKLSEIEFSLIKVHVQAGYDILKEIEFPWPIARIVLEHHERMNGSGYPNGLSGEQVLGESRILAVADVVEAMASHRPYRAALGINLALDEIAKNRGVLYDPEVVDACLLLFREKGYTFGNTGT